MVSPPPATAKQKLDDANPSGVVTSTSSKQTPQKRQKKIMFHQHRTTSSLMLPQPPSMKKTYQCQQAKPGGCTFLP